MKLTINGIGTVARAEIELNNLTVIAGENDTGKSTVGKVLFSLVQAFSNFPIAVKKTQQHAMQRDLDQLYFEIRRSVDLYENPEIRNLFSSLRASALQDLDLPIAAVVSVATEIIDSGTSSPASRDRIKKVLNRMLDEYNQGLNDEKAISRFVHRALKAEFAGEIVNKVTGGAAKVELSDGATKILEVVLDDKKVLDFKGGEPLGVRDATLVEGPAILQYYPAISEFNAIGERAARLRRGAIPYHSVDLATKLQIGKQSYDLLNSDKADSLDGFSDIFEGEMYYDRELSSFILDKGTVKIPSNNVASGIKAVAVLELLLRGDYIGSDTMLILDEPETNLHPTWQIKYAKIICELCKRGAKVLVTTHSPYMLEALRGYIDKVDEVSAKFYFSRKDEDGKVLYMDTFGDISPIIGALAQPLTDLVDELQADDF
ncbi:AAA family ATPase [Pseudomonas aeruginosa]|nr:AAA family ATPase [Pseudomonas aeruginosa]HEP9093890.1 AAA family ATPase [Pseudomonas aeruginosa]